MCARAVILLRQLVILLKIDLCHVSSTPLSSVKLAVPYALTWTTLLNFVLYMQYRGYGNLLTNNYTGVAGLLKIVGNPEHMRTNTPEMDTTGA